MTDILTPMGWEPTPNRRRFTRAECAFLEDNGLLTGRYELIDGEIISKMAQNLPHKIAVMLITAWLMRVFGDAFIQCQMSVGVDLADAEINAPEPDVSVLSRPLASLPDSEPAPADVLLLVEVSDSTRHFDLTTKARLYARAGIVEYWVADIKARRFVVHRNPTPTGYTEVTEYSAEAEIATLARPDAPIRVSELFSPA